MFISILTHGTLINADTLRFFLSVFNGTQINADTRRFFLSVFISILTHGTMINADTLKCVGNINRTEIRVPCSNLLHNTPFPPWQVFICIPEKIIPLRRARCQLETDKGNSHKSIHPPRPYEEIVTLAGNPHEGQAIFSRFIPHSRPSRK